MLFFAQLKRTDINEIAGLANDSKRRKAIALLFMPIIYYYQLP